MTDNFYLTSVSECPSDFIPSDAVTFIGVDLSKDGDCTVKGFYDTNTGKYHIQEVEYANERD